MVRYGKHVVYIGISCLKNLQRILSPVHVIFSSTCRFNFSGFRMPWNCCHGHNARYIIVHTAISVIPGIDLYLSEMKHIIGQITLPKDTTSKRCDAPALRGDKHGEHMEVYI